MWLGDGEAYVGVRKGGGVSMDLKGKYEGLKDAIKTHGAPKVVAMNAEDEQEWVAGELMRSLVTIEIQG